MPRSGSVTMHWQKVNCTGTETRLRDCDYKTGAYGCNGATFEAAVECKGWYRYRYIQNKIETRLMRDCNDINLGFTWQL